MRVALIVMIVGVLIAMADPRVAAERGDHDAEYVELLDEALYHVGYLASIAGGAPLGDGSGGRVGPVDCVSDAMLVVTDGLLRRPRPDMGDQSAAIENLHRYTQGRVAGHSQPYSPAAEASLNQRLRDILAELGPAAAAAFH